MEEVVYNDESIKELINDFKWTPNLGRIIITLNKQQKENEVILSEDVLDEEQYIVATDGRRLEPGMKVILDLAKLTIRIPAKHDQTQYIETINIDPVYTEQGTFGCINDNAIKMYRK